METNYEASELLQVTRKSTNRIEKIIFATTRYKQNKKNTLDEIVIDTI